jgi:hypothetical protein
MKRLLGVAVAAGVTAVMCLVMISPFASAAAPHRTAVCKQWSITGTWTSGQTNRDRVTYRFTQKGTNLTGTGTLSPEAGVVAGFRNGKLSGTVKGGHVHYIVVWEQSSLDGLVHRGLYVGTVSPRQIVGHTEDLTLGDEAEEVELDAHGPTKCVSYQHS